jgi:hypothetical protein
MKASHRYIGKLMKISLLQPDSYMVTETLRCKQWKHIIKKNSCNMNAIVTGTKVDSFLFSLSKYYMCSIYDFCCHLYYNQKDQWAQH